MTMYAVYVRNRAELDAQEELESLGVTCHVPRKVEMIRQGNRRRPDKVISALLPNYVFIEGGPEEWHLAMMCKTVRNLTWCSEREARKVMEYVQSAEAEFAAREAEIEQAQKVLADREATKAQRREALKAVQHFKAGELLEILDGSFKGRLASFAGIVERGTAPELLAELELFGRVATLRLDPLAVKRRVA